MTALNCSKVLIFINLQPKYKAGDNHREKVGKKDEIIFFQFRYFSIIARCNDLNVKRVQLKMHE